MAVQPIFQIKASVPSARTAMIKRVFLVMAVFMAVGGATLPMWAGDSAVYLSYLFYGIAAFDCLMAFKLSETMAKNGGPKYAFFADELVADLGARGSFKFPYKMISEVQEIDPSDADKDKGLETVQFSFAEPVTVPGKGRQTLYRLEGLPAQDFSYTRIKEIVEKSRAA